MMKNVQNVWIYKDRMNNNRNRVISMIARNSRSKKRISWMFRYYPKRNSFLVFTYRPGQLNWEYTMWKFQNIFALRFYVKLTLIMLKAQKLPFWPFGQLWILKFWEFLTFSSVKFPKNQNSKPPKWLKWQFLPSDISQNWFHVKSEWWQENC